MPDKEFKISHKDDQSVKKKKKKGHRQLNKIRKKVEEQNETINKEIKKIYFKKEQTRNPGVKNTVIALKKSLEVFNSRLD